MTPYVGITPSIACQASNTYVPTGTTAIVAAADITDAGVYFLTGPSFRRTIIMAGQR